MGSRSDSILAANGSPIQSRCYRGIRETAIINQGGKDKLLHNKGLEAGFTVAVTLERD
jgi:hypothetical protein